MDQGCHQYCPNICGFVLEYGAYYPTGHFCRRSQENASEKFMSKWVTTVGACTECLMLTKLSCAKEYKKNLEICNPYSPSTSIFIVSISI